MTYRISLRNLGKALAAVLVAGAGAAAAPGGFAAGGGQPISAEDRALGAKLNPQVLQQFGGGLSGPRADYVASVGRRIAMQSGLGNAGSDFTVTMLDSPVNNAFALPGGYVYVTRELVGLINNEAELAAVMGHEVGHVAARHPQKRQSAATQNSIIGVLGAVLSGAILGDSAAGRMGQQVFTTGSQLLTLKYSRAQETEADNLGVLYLRRAGYDPHAMGTVLESLARQNALDAQLRGTKDSVPEWASTHPDPALRVRAALSRAGAESGATNRDAYLAEIDGVVYGDDPAQGIAEGRRFIHPGLRMAFEAPEGYTLVNGARTVTISGGAGRAEMTSATFDGNLQTYMRTLFATLTPRGSATVRPAALESTTVNGIPAMVGTARVPASGGDVDVVVYAYRWSTTQVFHFLTVSQPGKSAQFNAMFRSMRRIGPAEAAAVKPRKVQVVTVKQGDSPRSLAVRMAYDDRPLDRFLVLNNLAPTARLVPGQRVKIVTW